MKTKVLTSVLATVALGAVAFFNNTPKKFIKSKVKTYKSKRTIPLNDNQDDSFDLFI